MTAGNFRDEIQAGYLAKAGVTAARAVLKDDAKHSETNKSDALTELWAQPMPPYPVGEGLVSIEIKDEAGKIDINRLGVKGQSDDTKKMLAKLLEVLEIEPGQIGPIVDAVKNWVDPEPLDDCAEDVYYQRLDPPYRCKKSPMDTLSELLLVKDVTPEIYRKIRPYLTTVSMSSNPININTADLPVLQTLYQDITIDTANCIQKNRPYTTPINASSFTGCSTSCLADPSCRSRIDIKSSYFTVKAQGIMHETEKIVTAMVKRNGTKVSLISWQTE
jgi:general secretion pathway protein K